jgi:citrate lyase subunit beta/citryl-CoA lyase
MTQSTAAFSRPQDILFDGQIQPARLPVCDHYAGNARFLEKALQTRAQMGPLFDITIDLEDGAAVGEEAQAATWAAAQCRQFALDGRGLGVRIHPLDHPAFRDDLNRLLQQPCPTLAYLMLPKVQRADDAAHAAFEIDYRCEQQGWEKPPALHVLIETPGAVLDAHKIAGLQRVESLSFGVMDYVSHFRGAIALEAMQSPLQFDHPLMVKARVELSMACHRFGKVASHNVCTDFRNMTRVAEDARRAREEFGFTRMWSIHPAQIPVIINAFAPEDAQLDLAVAVLMRAAAAQWGPIEHDGTLHDRASFRYFWHVLQTAHATGKPMPPALAQWFSAVQ